MSEISLPVKIKTSVKFHRPISRKRYGNLLIVGFALVGFLLAVTQVLGLSRDYFNYVEFFELVRNAGLNIIVESRFEPGFSLLALFLTSLFSADIFVYSCFVFFILLLKGWAINACSSSYKTFLIVAAFYFIRYVPLHELTQLRVAFGIALIFVGATVLWRGKLLIGSLICALAILFHMSVAAIIPALFISSSKRWQAISIPLFVYFITTLSTSFLTTYLSDYIQILNAYEENGLFGQLKPNPFSVYLLIDWGMIAVSLLMWKRLTELMRRIVILELIGLAIFYGAIDFSVIAIRVRELYSVFWVFFIADGLQQKGLKTITHIFVIECIIFYFYLFILFAEIPFFVKDVEYFY